MNADGLIRRFSPPTLQRGEGEGEREGAKPAAQQSDKVGYCFTVEQRLRRTAQQNAVRPPRPFPLLPLLLKRRLLVGEGGRREGAREGFRLRVSFKPRCNYRKQRRE